MKKLLFALCLLFSCQHVASAYSWNGDICTLTLKEWININSCDFGLQDELLYHITYEYLHGPAGFELFYKYQVGIFEYRLTGMEIRLIPVRGSLRRLTKA
ncbi:MAG TPA: hypothetical protein VFA52_01610 [Candidatus Paceibacterota bacterium]|nr:hypothetical protein [Candidatus Paceibacterota bacterium]